MDDDSTVDVSTPLSGLVPKSLDPFGLFAAGEAVATAWSKHPDELGQRMRAYLADLATIQAQFMARFLGAGEDAVRPSEHDERFQDPAWKDNPWFDYLKESYLLGCRALEDAIFEAPDVPEKTRRQAAFWTRQWLNAIAPSNFLWSNPAALRRMIASGGQSLVEGYRQWLADLIEGDVRIVDKTGFELGKDIAATPGQVVFRNDLLELIQFAPATAEVRQVPIVIVAPWINKYYVLDLDARRSLIRFLVGKGFTVFITSWKNPGPEMAETRFDDYLVEGALKALEVAAEIGGVEAVHGVGYCIGGTLLSCAQAWSAGDGGKPAPASSWTLFTTLVDFSNPGDIDVFITEDSVQWIEAQMERNGGLLDGKQMAGSFRWLRPNSLVWRYTVSSYLYGEEPPPMDVLQWNMDATRLPRAMHSFYLREFYLRNRLVEPGAVTLAGRPIDLRAIRAPLYAVGAEQDHIAPWKETFKIAGLVSGPVRYTLATSGHILGILSPPVDPPKRRYWSGDASGARDPEAWRAGLEKTPGSWWEDWVVWLESQCGPSRPARAPGSARYPALAPAPGTYVRES